MNRSLRSSDVPFRRDNRTNIPVEHYRRTSSSHIERIFHSKSRLSPRSQEPGRRLLLDRIVARVSIALLGCLHRANQFVDSG